VAKLYLPKIMPEKSTYLDQVKNIQKETLASIEIINGENKLDLKKENSVWKAGGKNADTVKIDTLLAALLPSVAPDVIAQTDKRYGELDLGDEAATKIRLGNSLMLFLGKDTAGGRYVRLEGNPSVYLLKNAPAVTTDTADWWDKTVVAIDQTKVTKLTFKDNDTNITIVKKDDKWLSEPDSKEAKKEKVDSVLFALSSLTAQLLYDEQSKTRYPKTANLTVGAEYDGKTEMLEFFKGESDYLVKRLSDGERYVVSEYTISSFLKFPQEAF